MGENLTRRDFLKGMGAGAALLFLGYGAYREATGKSPENEYDAQTTAAPVTENTVRTPAPTPESIVEEIKDSGPVATPVAQVEDSAVEDVIEYKDASIGTYEMGDKISYLGVDGEIGAGTIVNGKTESFFGIINEKKEPILTIQHGNYDIGHVEMISRDTDNDGVLDEVMLKVDGVDSGYIFRHKSWGNIMDYVFFLNNAENPEVQQYIIHG